MNSRPLVESYVLTRQALVYAAGVRVAFDLPGTARMASLTTPQVWKLGQYRIIRTAGAGAGNVQPSWWSSQLGTDQALDRIHLFYVGVAAAALVGYPPDTLNSGMGPGDRRWAVTTGTQQLWLDVNGNVGDTYSVWALVERVS